MKKYLISGLLLCFLLGCKKADKIASEDKQIEKTEMAYHSFGDEISEKGALSPSELSQKYADLQVGDTIAVKFQGKIDEVCQKKGCWMTIPLDKETTTMIRFKDYGFFVPLNAGNHETVVEGKAFVRETSVEELKHYAKDAGKSESEIAKIVAPKRELAFEASGVLIRQ